MAIATTTVWEVRTSGTTTAGGGYDSALGGTDYSQQDAPQLSLVDIATDGAGTGLSSATGGFTAAMVGNIIYLTGGGTTAGWYEITAHTDTNNVTIDRSAGASKTGVTGNVGGAFALGGSLDDEFFDAHVSGNTCWIKAGTYTLTETIQKARCTSPYGSPALPYKVIGYNSSRGDTPTGDNRPLLACGAYSFGISNDEFTLENIRATGTGTYVLGYFYASNYIFNCKAENSSGTANRTAIGGGSYTNNFIACEAVSTNGYAFGANAQTFFCYAHDSAIGAYYGTASVLSIFDTCTDYGVRSVGTNGLYCNNVFYNCGEGWSGYSVTRENLLFNNIFHSCTTGVSQPSTDGWSPLLYNSFYNCTTDVTNISKGVGCRAADPGLNDPANADFSITSSDDVYEQALDVMRYIAGVTV